MKLSKSRKPLKPRLVVWSFGMLLGLSIASFLGAKLWVTYETVRYLGEEGSASWETGTAAISERAQLWQTASLWAIGASLLLYAGSFVWYLSRGRR